MAQGPPTHKQRKPTDVLEFDYLIQLLCKRQCNGTLCSSFSSKGVFAKSPGGWEIEDFVENEENEEILEWYFHLPRGSVFWWWKSLLIEGGGVYWEHWIHWVHRGASKHHSVVILMWDRWIYLYLRRYRTRPQTSRFNFRPSKQCSFYVFGVFLDSRGRGTPTCKTYSWGSILTFFDKVCVFDKVRVLIFAHQNTVRSMFMEFL